MRIAMVCSNHAVTDARVTGKQALSLARAGHEVCVFGLKGFYALDLPGVELFPVAPFDVGIRARAGAIPRLWGPVLRWRPHVVTCHEPETAAMGLLLRSCCGARVVFDIHESWEESMAARAPRVLRPVARAAFKAALLSIARRCDWVTVVSPINYCLYRSIRYDGHVDFIHNSPPPELFPPCSHNVAGPVTICHEGMLSAQRGLVQLLEALALARQEVDVRLLLLGRVRPYDLSLYHQKVDALRLAEAIDFPGWIEYHKLGAALSRGQIGLVAMQPTPNNYQSLSNKIYNYMCCGQATIVPRGSATADLIREVKAGLVVDTTNPAEIAVAVVRLVRDRVLRRRLGDNGRRAILDRLGWHQMEKKLYDIYARLA